MRQLRSKREESFCLFIWKTVFKNNILPVDVTKILKSIDKPSKWYRLLFGAAGVPKHLAVRIPELQLS